MDEFIAVLGLASNLLFGCACIPLAWRAIRTGRANVPVASTWLFLAALSSFFGYLLLQFGFHLPFTIGLVEIACWAIVLRYHYFPRPTA